ncbi:MAG: hypothetical protein RSE07_04790 [Oscillospiraceae bacterium]
MLYNIPTSRDIFIEANGKRIAVVESYTSKVSRSQKAIKEFGNNNPVGIVNLDTSYILSLKRVYITDAIDFFKLENFNLVVCFPDKQVIYTNCQWNDISESIDIDKPIIESITLTANNRVVV